MTRVAANAIDYGDTATSISGRFHQSAGMVTMCISVYAQRAPVRGCMLSLGYRLSDCSHEMRGAADRARRTHVCALQTSRRRSRLCNLELVFDGVYFVYLGACPGPTHAHLHVPTHLHAHR